MRKITLLILACLLLTLGHAQYLTEGFESFPPTGWIDVPGGGTDSGNLWAQNATRFNSGANSAFYDDFDAPNDRWLISPVIDLSGAAAPALTYFDNVNFVGFADTHDVLYSTDYSGSGDPTVATWTLVNGVIGSEDTWVENGPYALPVSATVYVAFHYVGDFAAEWFIDDVLVDEGPSCGDPLALSADGNGVSATFTWSAGPGTATGYNWEIQPSGVVQGTPGALASGTEATTTASSGNVLTASTDYEFYVQQDCGGDGTSAYVQLSFNSGIPNNTPAGAIPITPSPEGTGCATATFTLPFSTDGTTDSGIQSSCNSSGLDQFFSWTATTDGLTFNSSTPGDPGIAVWDANTLAEIDCADTFSIGAVLSGWTIGQDLIIQIYDFAGSTSDVGFCLEEFTLPTAPDCAETPITPANGAVDVVVTAGEVTLTWTAPSGGVPPTDYRIFFGETSGALADLGTLPATGTTVDITGIAFSTTYFWQIVPENGGSPASGCPEWSFTTEAAPPPPANDDCANATVVAAPSTTPFDTTAATTDGPTDTCGTAPGAPNVWFTYTASGNGDLLVSTCNDADYDTKINVYDGSCGALNCIGGNDDGTGCANNTSEVSVSVVSGITYFISVNGFSGAQGTGNLTLDFTLSNGPELNNASAFSYYPNPVESTLTLNASSNNIDNVVMFNMLGQQVMQLQPNALNSELDMSSLQTGTYFVKVTVANETKTIRVVKQ